MKKIYWWFFLVVWMIISVSSQDCNQKPSWKKGDGTVMKECCKMPKVFDRSVFQGCSSSSDQNDQHNTGEHSYNSTKMRCFAECVLNSTKIMENGKINMKTVLNLIETNLSNDTDWTKIASEAATFCNDEANKKLSDFKASLNETTPDGKETCSPHASFFMKCLFGYKFANCPASKFDATNEKCTDMKNYFKSCNVPRFY